MTRTTPLPGLQDGEAGMLGRDVRSPCREGCRQGMSAPTVRKGRGQQQGGDVLPRGSGALAE